MQISSAEAVVTLTSSGNSLLQGLLRFTRNKPLGAIMGIIIVLVVLMSVFADVIIAVPSSRYQPYNGQRTPDREH